MRHCWCRIGRRQHDIHLRLLGPPLEEVVFVCFALASKLPVLISTLGMPVANQAGPDTVALNVADVQVVDVFDEPWKAHIAHHLSSAFVVPFARAEM